MNGGERLPGADLIANGVQAHRRREIMVDSLLVAIGSPRLHRLGLDLPERSTLCERPEIELYRLLGERYGRDAHQRYNALIRRLVSYERAAERVRSARQRG